MLRVLRFIFFIFLIFIITGCKKEKQDYNDNIKEVLKTPINLMIINNILSWDNVENATNYYVSYKTGISSHAIKVNKNWINLSTLSNNSFYDICVKALNENYYESNYSERIDHFIPLDTPKISIEENGNIKWDIVDNGQKYKIYFKLEDEVIFVEEIIDNYYNIYNINKIGNFEIYVQTLGSSKEINSNFSDSVFFEIKRSNLSLSVPTNLTIENNQILKWDPVEEAVTYSIKILSSKEDIIYNTTNCEFDLSILKKGGYKIFVEAVGDGIQSSGYSVSKTYVVSLNSPENLIVEEGILIWDGDDDATKYEIYINGDKYIDVKDNKFSLNDLSVGKYKIKICASSEFLKSKYSEEIEVNIEKKIEKLN